VLARLALSPGLLVLELAVVEDATDGRSDVGSDLHEVRILLARNLQGAIHGHNAQFFAVRSDYENLWGSYSLVDTEFANYACNLTERSLRQHTTY
jgi:hypothetical protein